MARLVRCPKCTKLLVEYPENSVYKCGGCDTILRARNHKSAAKFEVTGSPQASIASKLSEQGIDSSVVPEPPTEEFIGAQLNQPDVISENGFSDKEMPLPSSSAASVQEEHGEEDKELNVGSSHDDVSHEHDVEGQHSESLTKVTKERVPSTDDLSLSRINRKIEVEKLQVEVLQPEDTGTEDEQVGKSREETNDVANLQSTSQNTASEEDDVNREQHSWHDDGAKSPATVSSQIYDGSVSSYDGERRSRSHPLSRRTFKHRTPSKILPKDNEDIFGNDKVTSYMDGEDQARAQLSNSGNESHYNDVIRSFNAIKEEIISKYESGELARLKSFDSEEFMSVDSWMEEKIGSFKSLPKGLKGNFNEHMELLRKVDELKAQIIDLYIEGGDHKQNHIRSIHNGHQFDQSSNPSYRREYITNQLYKYPSIPFSANTHCSCLHCMENQQSHFPVHNLHSQYPNSVSSSKHNHVLEKSRSEERPKHHCRPVSGAAPFVICYHCMKLLQLPADFIISRRKLHKLQCGACNEILMLSFPGKIRKTNETSREVDGKLGSSSHSMQYPLDTKSKAPPRLHRLMGYDSATELLYTRDDFDEGYESMNSPARHSYRLSTRSHSDIRILERN